MKYIFLIACLLFTLSCHAQDRSIDTMKAYTYDQVQQMPAPDYDLPRYIAKHMRYPDSARRYDVEGRVIVRFIVNEDGHISDCEIKKGIGAGCDKEALRMVSNMPPWTPGKKDGKTVRVFFYLPLVFKLK